MRFHSPVIIVKERFQEIVKFYSEVLGQEVESDFGACVIFRCGLSVWQPSPEHIVAPMSRPTEGHSFELCFETDDDHEFFRRVDAIKAAPVKLLHDVREEAWGQRTIRFYDPSGNLIEYGESVPCFVRRTAAEGRGAEEVSAKTGVSIERVSAILSSAL
jgi:catechol 2,3-dioxygenase-like lactoylglutathione lyase family enzyme